MDSKAKPLAIFHFGSIIISTVFLGGLLYTLYELREAFSNDDVKSAARKRIIEDVKALMQNAEVLLDNGQRLVEDYVSISSERVQQMMDFALNFSSSVAKSTGQDLLSLFQALNETINQVRKEL